MPKLFSIFYSFKQVACVIFRGLINLNLRLDSGIFIIIMNNRRLVSDSI